MLLKLPQNKSSVLLASRRRSSVPLNIHTLSHSCQTCRPSPCWSARRLSTTLSCRSREPSEEVIAPQGCSLRLASPTDLERSSVESLYDQVGWPSGTAIANAWRGLQQSQYVSILTTDEGDLAGLARATSDLAYNAQICDVVILPDYQGAGYGRALVKLLICFLLEQKIENITLFADKEAVGFYETLGFERGVNKTKAMCCLNVNTAPLK